MTRKPAPTASPVGELDRAVLAPDHERAEEEERTALPARGPASASEPATAARRDERRAGVQREPQLLGHVFFLGTEIDEGERRQGLGLKNSAQLQIRSRATAEQQRHQASRSRSQTNRHLLHRELPLAMHLRRHRYG